VPALPVWTGEDALFWSGGSTASAYNVATNTWRNLDAGTLTPRPGTKTLWADGIMLSWSGFDNGAGSADGIALRPLPLIGSEVATTPTTTFDGAAGCPAPEGRVFDGPLAGSQLVEMSAVSIAGPMIGVVDAPSAPQDEANIGRVAISADGTTIAATIDRRGPDEILINTDHEPLWKSIGTTADVTHLALSEDGSILAVSGPTYLGLYRTDSADPPRVVPLPPTNATVASLAFAGNEVLVASLELGDGTSEFANPSQIFYLDPIALEWTQAPIQPNAKLGFIFPVVATRDAVSYLFVESATADIQPTAVAELWTIGVDGVPSMRFNSLPLFATLVGYTDTSVILGEYDDAVTYRIQQRGGGDKVLTLGCLRPGSAQNLNNDPDLH
jgi:hypothetical protein